jgi:hypothetical protein
LSLPYLYIKLKTLARIIWATAREDVTLYALRADPNLLQGMKNRTFPPFRNNTNGRSFSKIIIFVVECVEYA